MPTVDSRLDVPKCKVPKCPNKCEIKEITMYGRVRHRNVCKWHHKHKDTLEPPSVTGSGVPNPYAPRVCAFPKCGGITTSLGVRKNGRLFAKWCFRHRAQWMRDLAYLQHPELRNRLAESIHDIPNPSLTRPQASSVSNRPHQYPKEEYVRSRPMNPRKLKKIAEWLHGPHPTMGRAVIETKFPGRRVVYNDDGYVTWATGDMIRGLDAAVSEGILEMKMLMQVMNKRVPKVFHPRKSVWQGDTFPRVTTSLVTLLLRWLTDPTKRKKMGLDPIALPNPVTMVTGRTAAEEAKMILRRLKRASKPIVRKRDSF